MGKDMGATPTRVALSTLDSHQPPGSDFANNVREFEDAVLWLARAASPWRDLPPELGNWRTVHGRFRRWTRAGVWDWGDCPQAQSLIAGLEGVGHVVADAGYASDPVRRFIADDLGARARSKPPPSRAGPPPIDWALHRARRLAACLCNRIRRVRRIALRCEKTVTSFRALVALARAMARLA